MAKQPHPLMKDFNGNPIMVESEPSLYEWVDIGNGLYVWNCLVCQQVSQQTTDGSASVRHSKWCPTPKLTQDLDEAIKWIRVVGEELVNAGFPAGDRTVHLASIRQMLKPGFLMSACEHESCPIEKCAATENPKILGERDGLVAVQHASGYTGVMTREQAEMQQALNDGPMVPWGPALNCKNCGATLTDFDGFELCKSCEITESEPR
jgi:hypothetical protein